MLSGWRFVGPVVLATCCLVALCVFTAVSLFHQQATVAEVFRENVASRRAAVEMEECLNDLIALEQAHIEAVGPLHDRIRAHLVTLRGVADDPEEVRLYTHIVREFDAYLGRLVSIPPPGHPAHVKAFEEVTRLLETDVLRPTTEFRLHSGRRLEQTTREHEQVLNRLAWGMAGVAGLGGVAGLILGFGVAGALSRSIRRLQVQIRDAAGKLGPAAQEIVVTEQGGFFGLHRDIDQLTGKIEGVLRELQQREREVLRAEQLAAVGQLAAGVGHEIRNPLTSIKLLVQAAIENPGAAPLTGDDLRVIENEVRRIEYSLQTFLDFARPPKVERRATDLLTVLNGVVGLVRGRAEKHRVAVWVESLPGPLVLDADPGQLRQVFVNLALNALDAMPNGGSLVLRVRRHPDRTEVEVADTGPGIPAAVLPRLFTPFVSTKDTGLGLGLVISKRIVEDHGGTIDVGNRPGGGASFFVRLPAGAK